MSQPQMNARQGDITVERIFDKLQAYRIRAALKTAIELDFFTQIGAGATTAEEIAAAIQVPARGVRVVCDFLVTDGVLNKQDGRYSMVADVAAFLDRRSPYYLGGMSKFLASEALMRGFENLTDCVRRGGTAEEVVVTADQHPVWMEFARGMAALQEAPAHNLAALLDLPSDRPIKVLDIAASHGQFGIAVAKKYPQAVIYALDWPSVLEVTQEHAERAGIGERFRKLPGNAFEVELVEGLDAVMLTNFLHHFPTEEIEPLLARIYGALNEGGQVVIGGFVPNDDGVSPAYAARFNLSVLASTPKGEAHSFSTIKSMLEKAGFNSVETAPIPPGLQTLITARK